MHEGIFAIAAADIPALQHVNSETCEQENEHLSNFKWVVGNMSIYYLRLYIWQLCDFRNRRRQIRHADKEKLVRDVPDDMIYLW